MVWRSVVLDWSEEPRRSRGRLQASQQKPRSARGGGCRFGCLVRPSRLVHAWVGHLVGLGRWVARAAAGPGVGGCWSVFFERPESQNRDQGNRCFVVLIVGICVRRLLVWAAVVFRLGCVWVLLLRVQ